MLTDHSIIEDLGWKGPPEVCSPNFCSEHVQLEQVVQGLAQPDTGYLHGERFHKLLGQAISAFDHFLVKSFQFYK